MSGNRTCVRMAAALYWSRMSKKQKMTLSEKRAQPPARHTPTFLLELPLQVNAGQAKRLRAHLEAGRQFYNAVLSEGQRRLRRMRADPAWQAARPSLAPRSRSGRRLRALRERYGFSEYALHTYAKGARHAWLAEHLDAVLAQTLATRAYRALNRVCLGQARRVRFKSRGRGLSSIENKRNDTGLRFVLQTPGGGQRGLSALEGRPAARPHRLERPGGHVRLESPHQICPPDPAQSQQPTGAGSRCPGLPLLRATGSGRRALPQAQAPGGQRHHRCDLGPSTIALVPREAEASLQVFCEDLVPMRSTSVGCSARWTGNGARPIRATTTRKGASRQQGVSEEAALESKPKLPENATQEGQPKSASWRLIARACMAARSMRSWRWATPSSLEKISYKAWQKQYGRKRGTARPRDVRRHVETHRCKHGRHPARSSHTHDQTLASICHGCGKTVKKPLSQRWHQCACGIGPVQRDLYSAFLAAYLDPRHPDPSRAQYHRYWEGAEARLRAAHEEVAQRANEGQVVPRSFGIPRAGARLPRSLSEATQEPAFLLTRGRLEAWKHRSEPPLL